MVYRRNNFPEEDKNIQELLSLEHSVSPILTLISLSSTGHRLRICNPLHGQTFLRLEEHPLFQPIRYYKNSNVKTNWNRVLCGQ